MKSGRDTAEFNIVQQNARPVRIEAPASVTRTTVAGSKRSQETKDALGAHAFNPVLRAARAGAEWAWARLLDDIDPVLRGYLKKQGAHDPDDLAGETWLHVARGIKTFEGNYPEFRSWVFMVAHHRIIDERRRRGRRPERPEGDAMLEAAAPSNRSAEAETVAIFEHDELEELLGRLSPPQREVVLLRVVAGFGITEIAAIIGKKPGAVQALQHRAFRRLRKILEGA